MYVYADKMASAMQPVVEEEVEVGRGQGAPGPAATAGLGVGPRPWVADRSVPPPLTHLTHTALAVITQYIPTRAISPYQHVGLEFLVSDCR